MVVAQRRAQRITITENEDNMAAKNAKHHSAHDHGSSIKRPAVYEALRREGMDKSKAAAISNSMASGGKRSGSSKKK